MKFNAAYTTAVLALLLAGVLTSNAQRDYKDQSLDLLRLLASKPWASAPYGRWEPRPPEIDSRIPLDDDVDDEFKASSKRSAVATALNSGRRRRQPTPALGVLNDVGSFFDSLRDNLETLTSLTPSQRSTLFQGPPSVVNAPSSDLTTADRSWRPMGTQMQTATTQGCCGPDWAARVFPTYPHPHARFRFSRNTRENTYNTDAEPDSDGYTQTQTLPILFPEYFIAYENVDPLILSDDSFEVPRTHEDQNVHYNSHVPLDSELGLNRLQEYFTYRFPRRIDEVDNEKTDKDNDNNDSTVRSWKYLPKIVKK